MLLVSLWLVSIRWTRTVLQEEHPYQQTHLPYWCSPKTRMPKVNQWLVLLGLLQTHKTCWKLFPNMKYVLLCLLALHQVTYPEQQLTQEADIHWLSVKLDKEKHRRSLHQSSEWVMKNYWQKLPCYPIAILAPIFQKMDTGYLITVCH